MQAMPMAFRPAQIGPASVPASALPDSVIHFPG
jgi:hypothetical protein